MASPVRSRYSRALVAPTVSGDSHLPVHLRHLFICSALMLVSSSFSRTGLAADSGKVDDATRSAARQLGTEGVHAYQAGDYAKATERLERAYKALQAPSLGLWSARALEKTGQLVKAAERYLQTTRLPVEAGGEAAVQERAKQDAAAEREALLPRIPGLVVVIEGVTGDEVEVRINGASVNSALLGTSRPTDPGTAEVVASHRGREVRRTVTLAEGETETVTLHLEAGSASSAGDAPLTDDQEGASTKTEERAQATAAQETGGPRVQPILGWTGIALGAAGLAVGGIAAGVAYGSYPSASEGCLNNRCPVGTNPEQIAGYNEMRVISSVGFIVGGVLAATGITLLITMPKASDSASVRPYLGLTSVGVSGSF